MREDRIRFRAFLHFEKHTGWNWTDPVSNWLQAEKEEGPNMVNLRCIEHCELPFMLNLPDGPYQLPFPHGPYSLEIQQGLVALHTPTGGFAVGLPNFLAVSLPAEYATGYKQRLRTVVLHVHQREMAENDLPVVTEEDVLNAMQGQIIGEDPFAHVNRTEQLKEEAQRRLAAMTAADLDSYRMRLRKMCGGQNLHRPDQFLEAVNRLIRLYMQRFDDHFVEEVTLHQLAGQYPFNGVFVNIECDGVHLKHFGRVGKVPPMMRSPWLIHSPDQITLFRKALQDGESPESAALLETRAKSFLERGATRSAIIEASAALDLTITKKLREGFIRQGKTPAEIDVALSEIRFGKRANKLMNDATGQRVSAIDQKLYDDVMAHREAFRHGIAHADTEPPVKEATKVVEDFKKLRMVVSAI